MKQSENRCAHCGGKFGLVLHHHWRLRFCRQTCKNHYVSKIKELRADSWFDYLFHEPSLSSGAPETTS